MDLLTYLAALRRWWWIPLLLLLLVLGGAILLTPAAPYATEFRATVLIPGDTEDTGSAERPELMVLDDLPSLIGSDVYAGATLERMRADGTAAEMDLGEVRQSLSGSRYSRVLTVTVRNAGREDARAIAAASAAVLPETVNAYLVAPGAEPATVQLIDQPREPVPATNERWRRIGAMALAALFAGLAIVAVLATQVHARSKDSKKG